MSERGFVVVTGASTGIGRSAAIALLRAGFTVFAGVRKDADARAVQADGLRPLLVDVTDAESVATARDLVEAEVGARGLHGLVNNAGIAIGGPLECIDLEEVRRQLDVNVIGLLRTTQAFVPALRRGRGRIANVGSMAGRVANPFLAPYAASKHAVEALTDALRMELAPWGIKVSVLEPGAIKTPIWGKGEDYADVIMRGLNDDGRRLYGEVIPRFVRLVQRSAARAVSTSATDAAIVHALTAPSPKARYPVGTDARVGLFARSVLPTTWMDRVVLRAMGMERARERSDA